MVLQFILLVRTVFFKNFLSGFVHIILNISVTADDFQRSFKESFGDSINEFRRTVWHWVNLIEGGQMNE